MNLLLILFLFSNATHLILTVNEPKVGEIRPTFDEIFGKGWDKDGHEKIKVETSPLNSGENALNEQADHDDNIDQDVEAYNSDSTDHNFTQEDPPDRIDQSDDETNEGINEENEFNEKEKFSEQQKREIICKFHAMRKEYKQKGKYPTAEWLKIEYKIGIKLGANRRKIYKWKNEFGLSRKIKINKSSFYEKKKREFIKRMEEIKMCQPGEQKKLVKDLGISEGTFINWKKEHRIPITKTNIIYSDSEKMELIVKYYKIKQRNPEFSERDIANMLNISRTTIYRWKKQLKNSVDEHSLPENRQSFATKDTSEHSMASSDDYLWAWNLAKKKRTERMEVEHTLRKKEK